MIHNNNATAGDDTRVLEIYAIFCYDQNKKLKNLFCIKKRS